VRYKTAWTAGQKAKLIEAVHELNRARVISDLERPFLDSIGVPSDIAPDYKALDLELEPEELDVVIPDDSAFFDHDFPSPIEYLPPVGTLSFL